eukprot:TRINITY_DN1330_c1_g2_i1.p1 TRINITY_DN1330_c1_g2~~TRINITY_DN1330_c1_g2_i1.p1  ORF type:complete len:660 (-),score=90.61 TRINITY_DN1330_c1_g2_i1:18-1997(-)
MLIRGLISTLALARHDATETHAEPNAIFERGVQAFQRGDTSAAKEEFSRALQLSPANATLWEALAEILLAAESTDDAAQAYLKAASLEPESSSRWNDAGFALGRIGGKRLHEAESALRRAYSMADPSDREYAGEVAAQFGIVLGNLGRPSEAVQMLQHASSLRPSDLRVPLQLGRLLAVLPERPTEAIHVLASTLRRTSALPSDEGSFTWFSGGDADSSEAAEMLQIRHAASKELRQILSRERPMDASAARRMTYMSLEPGSHESETAKKLDAAISGLSALIQENPQEYGLVWELGNAFANSYRHAEAERAYRRAGELAPSNEKLQADMWFNSAVVVSRQGRSAEAVEMYRNVLSYNPKEIKAYEYLGDALLHNNAVDEARDAYMNAALLYASFNASFRFLLNYHSSSDEFWERRLVEASALHKFVELKSSSFEIARSTPEALRVLRDAEVNATWQVSRLLECARVFGASESTKFTCGYGVSWFDTAWLPVMQHALVAQALEASREPESEVLVLGSALGEHCLFTSLLLGVRCVGYDLLCETNVGMSERVNPDGSLAEFKCDNVVNADLSRARLVWLLDAVWPEEIQILMEKRLAAELPSGSVVVLYREPVWRDSGALVAHIGAVHMEVSWRRELPVTLLQKPSAGGETSLADGRSAEL